MANNAQSRKWLMVINNPKQAGFDHDTIENKLKMFSPRYYCMSDEIASTGTEHTHIFLMSDSPIRFSTIKARFPIAHIEKAYGSAQNNRDYIRKEGKWADSDKAETSVPGSFVEWGDVPTETEEKSPMMAKLLCDIQAGMSTADIIKSTPNLAFRIQDINTIRQTFLAEKYSKENRSIVVSYLYGASGTGKTKSIYATHDATNICRITNYPRGGGIKFDAYNGHDVLVFEEFKSQINIEDMLNYLDIYPLMLPARYSDRVACYTKVYITANEALEKQYANIRMARPETWRAFLRRIHNVKQFLPDGSIREIKKGGKIL